MEKKAAKEASKPRGRPKPENYATVKGALKWDATLRKTANGNAVSNAVLDIPTLHGETRTSVRVTAWDGAADKLGALKAGDVARVTGTIRSRAYDKDGRKVEVTEINASEVLVLARSGAAQAGEEDIPF